MNKFILTRKSRKYTQDDNRPNVRIDSETYQALVKVAYETGIPITHIAIRAIKFALENIEYVDME